MSSETQVIAEIDFDRDGTHAGYLRVPHSVHRSAYGWIPLPVISIRNGAGPVILLMGGNHGDEYEGQVALSRLARTLDARELQGQVILLPMANYPAARAGCRTSPLDGGNLNRSFPGDPRGGPTAMIAHFIETQLLTRADYLLDIHSGGSSMRYRPTLLVARHENPVQQQKAMELLRALGFPRAVLYPESSNDSYSSSAARRNGVIGMTAEMAGGGSVDRDAMTLLYGALTSYLGACGVLRNPPVATPGETMFFQTTAEGCYLYARREGVFEPAAGVDDEVTAGQTAGWIHHPDVPLSAPHELHFDIGARVLSVRVPARVERGDCLFELGIPLETGSS
jgi:predicted deacylase